jgi:hypothetical protein
MKTNALFLAIRAISAEFARRLFLPIVITIAATLLVALILVGWLTTVSGWWWLLLIVIISATIIFAGIVGVAMIALTVLRPAQNKQQRVAIREFVDKLQEVSETVQTPKLFLFFRLIKDVIFPSDRGLISQVSSHVTTLRPDFNAIIALFK